MNYPKFWITGDEQNGKYAVVTSFRTKKVRLSGVSISYLEYYLSYAVVEVKDSEINSIVLKTPTNPDGKNISVKMFNSLMARGDKNKTAENFKGSFEMFVGYTPAFDENGVYISVPTGADNEHNIYLGLAGSTKSIKEMID